MQLLTVHAGTQKTPRHLRCGRILLWYIRAPRIKYVARLRLPTKTLGSGSPLKSTKASSIPPSFSVNRSFMSRNSRPCSDTGSTWRGSGFWSEAVVGGVACLEPKLYCNNLAITTSNKYIHKHLPSPFLEAACVDLRAALLLSDGHTQHAARGIGGKRLGGSWGFGRTTGLDDPASLFLFTLTFFRVSWISGFFLPHPPLFSAFPMMVVVFPVPVCP